jgi:hypothetical protein
MRIAGSVKLDDEFRPYFALPINPFSIHHMIVNYCRVFMQASPIPDISASIPHLSGARGAVIDADHITP